MILRSLSDVTLEDVSALVENRVAEGDTIDFKVAAVGHSDRDKREFLADVCAFANAGGGDLVLGVSTRNGVASEIPGVALEDPDREKLRLGDVVRYGLEPRLEGVGFAWLATAVGIGVMVVRVPRSWSAPHRVTFNKDMNFFVRNAAGKHPMNVDEIRRAFTLSATVSERVAAFRHARLQAIRDGDLPFQMHAEPRFVLHVTPVASFVEELDLPLDSDVTALVPPVGGGGHDYAYMLEGMVTFSPARPVRHYSLSFRRGAAECVAPVNSSVEPSVLALVRLERHVANGWSEFARFARAFALPPPFVVMASLLGVKGYVPVVPKFEYEWEPTPWRRDDLLLPPVTVTVDGMRRPSETLFRRLFDMAAQAFGLPGSMSFDEHGNFRG